MSSIDSIKAPVAQEIKQFENHFRNSMKSNVPLLDIIMNYILRRKGKQMRPILVFLSAKLHGDITPSTFNAASLIELLHTATLIHDDVVDESYQRRGFFSINALWKSKIAVLVGDFLLSKGLLLAVDKGEFELLKIVSEAVREMAEGELLQIEKSRKLNITEEVYYEIIKKKTATLIASCTASGAKSVNADAETVQKMKLFGENVGIAFQIKDDLLDLQKNNLTGKPSGNDIQEKKLTLPVIFAIKNGNSSESSKILRIIKSKTKSSKEIDTVINFVEKNDGINYAIRKMKEFKQNALDILNSFPENDARKSLFDFVEFTIERNK